MIGQRVTWQVSLICVNRKISKRRGRANGQMGKWVGETVPLDISLLPVLPVQSLPPNLSTCLPDDGLSLSPLHSSSILNCQLGP